MMQEQVKQLWKLCFEDSDEFIDMYFGLRYNNEVNVAIQHGEQVIAALQMLPYPMTWAGGEISTAYISGACTHPGYRKQGAMHQLLLQAFARMLHAEAAISTLIPAEPWLFNYYARTGYAPLFGYSQSAFTAALHSPLPADMRLKKSDEFEKETYDYLNRQLRKRPCCIQHTEADFRVVLADLRLSRGAVFTLHRGENIVALAVAQPENHHWLVQEIVADHPDMHTMLLQCICETLHLPTLSITTPPVGGKETHPRGMARIIHAKTVLQRYAAANPQLEMSIHLTDEQISTNNGYYYLLNGQCTHSTNHLPGSHQTLTIGELTGKIFSPSQPYMSLMMD